MSEKPSNTDVLHSHPLTPGEILCRGRKEKGLAAEEVMIHLGITQRTFHALEHDEYDLLPSPLYVKGYIKRYCSILGISDAEVLAGFDAKVNELGLASKEPMVRLGGQPKVSVSRWKIVAIIFSAIFLIVFAWFYLWAKDNNSSTEGGEQTNTLFEGDGALPSAKSDVLINDNQTVKNISPDNVSVGSSDIESSAEIEVNRESEITNSLESTARDNLKQIDITNTDITNELIRQEIAAEPAPKVFIAPNANVLHITVTQRSWIEILDAKGDILLADLKTSGYQGEVKGTAPFDVILGYAPGVKLTLNGKRVEIPIIGNDNTAKLKIGDKEG